MDHEEKYYVTEAVSVGEHKYQQDGAVVGGSVPALDQGDGS